LRLSDRSHFDPVTEHHDGHQRRELPPQIGTGEAEGHRQAEPECDRNRERNERHHPGQAVANLADGTPDEDPPAVPEHQRAEHRRNPARYHGSARRIEGEPVLNHRRPDHGGDRQQQRPPEFLTEHLDGVASVFVVATHRVATLSAVRMMGVTGDVGAYRWTVL
jgi:hypothetical protein